MVNNILDSNVTNLTDQLNFEEVDKMKECPICHSIGSDKNCPNCSKERSTILSCNWCDQQFLLGAENCPACNRTKKEATTLFPPMSMIKQLFLILLGKTNQKQFKEIAEAC